METLWLEFENGKTDVAKWVKDMDILQRAHRAMLYEERSGKTKDFEVFRVELEGKIKHPKAKSWAEGLLKNWAVRRSRRDTDMIIIFALGK